MPELRTERLLLRQWLDADLGPFAALNADPEVMLHFPAPLTARESDELATHCRRAIAERGYGLWAVEVVERAPFAGFVGLAELSFAAHFTPATEIGWRLGREHWGHGYATEAARAIVAFAFDDLELDELVSITTVANNRSRRVMTRLGMTHDPAGDFDHPRLPASHPQCRHVLYRLPRTAVRSDA